MQFAKLSLTAVLLGLSCTAAFAQTGTGVIGMDTLLRQESDISQLPHLRNWTTSLQSSYDRTGGNGDSGNYLALNGNTATILDASGPGALVRFWTAGSGAHINIYIDDNPTPVIASSFGSILDGSGSVQPFVSPLSGDSSGGSYTYMPIPYAKHCRVTLDSPGGLYYQVNYVTFAPGTVVRPFSMPLSAADQAAVNAAAAAWKAPSIVLDPLPVDTHSVTPTIGAGKVAQLSSDKGPGVISRIQFQSPDATDAELRQLVLRAYFDGHKTPDIEAPAADFFGNAYGRKPFASLLMSQSADGVMEARFPMPFGRSARFTLENGTKKSLRIRWNVVMTHTAFHSDQDGYFHALWSQEITRAGVPHVWTHVQGQRGHYVGVVQTMAGVPSFGYLEGDDQFRADAQVWGKTQVTSTVMGPWNGTGTEDAFNSGWYFDKGTNALPLNGLLVKDTTTHTGHINVYRWFLNDAPVFQQSLDAQLEHGGANDAPGMYYSSVAYWYADEQSQPWAAMPAASAIQPPIYPKAVIFPALDLKNPIEGESLIDTAKVTGGKVQGQDMSGFDSSWSGDNQLFWTEGKVGDTLTLTLPAHPGVYDLVGYFTKAGDYGQVTFALNGQPVGSVFDGYNGGVVNSGPIALGRVTLPAGPSQFVVTITGKNAAGAGTLFGLDALVLNPVK